MQVSWIESRYCLQTLYVEECQNTVFETYNTFVPKLSEDAGGMYRSESQSVAQVLQRKGKCDTFLPE